MIRDGVLRLRLDDRELWSDWKIEYGESESEHEAPAVLITFEVQGWQGLGRPSSGEAHGRVDFHFRGHEPERRIVAATLKRIAEELDPTRQALYEPEWGQVDEESATARCVGAGGLLRAGRGGSSASA